MTVQLNDVLSGKGSRAREEQHKAVIDSQIVIVPESTDVCVTRPWLYSREFSGYGQGICSGQPKDGDRSRASWRGDRRYRVMGNVRQERAPKSSRIAPSLKER